MCDSKRHNRNCEDRGRDGGAIAFVGVPGRASSMVIDTCVFTGNQAQNNGGGLSAKWLSKLVIRSSIFSSNWAMLRGGALSLWDSVMVTITGCLFTGNKVVTWGGGALSIMYSVSDIEADLASSNLQKVSIGIEASHFEKNECDYRGDGFGGAVRLQMCAKTTWSQGCADHAKILNISGCSFVLNTATYYGAHACACRPARSRRAHTLTCSHRGGVVLKVWNCGG